MAKPRPIPPLDASRDSSTRKKGLTKDLGQQVLRNAGAVVAHGEHGASLTDDDLRFDRRTTGGVSG